MPVYGRSRPSARARAEQALEALFKRHHAPLLSYCRHMLGDQDEAEDALQQTFIRAHRALLGGIVPREPRPWLYAIARNCCLSAIAARKPTTPLESLANRNRMPALQGLSEEVHRREDLRELVAGIARLPEDQRSALLLAELEDLSHREIARIVGCPVSKVRALIYQARSTLLADRDALGAPCQDIREQLAVARGGELRRGPLRRHLNLCAGCRDFQLALSTQHRSLGVVLPVLPSAGLAAAILGHAATHTAGAASLGGAGAGLGAGGVATTGGASSSALVGGSLAAKVAVGGAIAALAAAGAVAIHRRPAHGAQRVAIAASGRRASTPNVTPVADPSDGTEGRTGGSRSASAAPPRAHRLRLERLRQSRLLETGPARRGHTPPANTPTAAPSAPAQPEPARGHKPRTMTVSTHTTVEQRPAATPAAGSTGKTISTAHHRHRPVHTGTGATSMGAGTGTDEGKGAMGERKGAAGTGAKQKKTGSDSSSGSNRARGSGSGDGRGSSGRTQRTTAGASKAAETGSHTSPAGSKKRRPGATTTTAGPSAPRHVKKRLLQEA